MYKILFRLFFRHFDPELMHKLGAAALPILALFSKPQRVDGAVLMGLNFENRLGVAAGFDKNAKHIMALYRLGFGHVEIGTVTPQPQSGNPKPRMFRIWEQSAIINRMGFNNDGAAAVAKRLEKARRTKHRPIIGVNIGKNKLTEAALAVADYERCADSLAKYADYLVVNVSSPNTPGLRDLQQIESLRPILAGVKRHSGSTPVLVKIAPDLADDDVLAVADLVNELDLAGVIAANTTIGRAWVAGHRFASESGGLSGPMLAARAEEMIGLLKSRLAAGRTIISVGGVSSAADLKRRLDLGADLVQAYTGFVYGGPAWPSRIQRQFTKR